MKSIGLVIGGLLLCVAITANAQIELGVEDISGTINKSEKSKAEEKKASSISSLGGTIDLFWEPSKTDEKKTVSVDELKEKANKGDVEAQLDLGYMYLYGVNGVNSDYKLALQYYEMAAEKKNAVALNNLGSLYFNGIGTNVDYAKAIAFFEEASRLGSNDAAVNLAVIYLGSNNKNKGDFKKIYNLLNKAQKNNNIAKFMMGYAYFTGFMVEKNYRKAFSLIKTAADAQYDEAQLVLANLYIKGQGTTKNYNRAIQYLRQAVAQGNRDAIMQLADILAEGKIFTQNVANAHVLYNVASVMGSNEAAEKRDNIEKHLKIEDLLAVQAEAENYKAVPSQLTSFIRQTYGNSLKVYIDNNLNAELAIKIVDLEEKK